MDGVIELEDVAEFFPGDFGCGAELVDEFGVVAVVLGKVVVKADDLAVGQHEVECVEFLEGAGEFERGGGEATAFLVGQEGAVADEVDGVLEGALFVEDFEEFKFELF